MGNCQAVEAATMVIQHPCGKIQRLYCPISVDEVMKTNPGHYVSLIIPLPASVSGDSSSEKKSVRYTRVKLLRPTDNLALGHAYRLLTSQEVMKVLEAKKYAKMKKSEQERSPKKQNSSNIDQDEKDNSERSKTTSTSTPSIARGSRLWRPSLQSISEGGS